MATKDKRATDKLNVELSGIDSALTILKSLLGESDSPARKMVDQALERCEAARDALLTIQFHSAQI
jgi:hypothetical protein